MFIMKNNECIWTKLCLWWKLMNVLGLNYVYDENNVCIGIKLCLWWKLMNLFGLNYVYDENLWM